MGYNPSLSDLGINQESSEPSTSYSPSLADLGMTQQAKEPGNIFEEMGKYPSTTGDIRDFMYGVGHAGERIAKLLYGQNMPAMPDIRQQNPNPLFEGAGQYAPFGAAGGLNVLGQAAAGAAHGFTQYDPKEHGIIDTLLKNKGGIEYGGRLRNTLEDALLGGVFQGAGNLLGKYFKMPPPPAPMDEGYKIQATFKNTPSEFTNAPFKPPAFLTEQPPAALSPGISNDIATSVMGNRNLEASGKELASHINKTYEGVKGRGAQKFNDVFDSSTGVESYHTGEPILVKDQLMHNSDYRKQNLLKNSKDKNLELLNNKFIHDPSVKNAHDLQSELGSEIGYLKRQRENNLLDAEGKNRLNEYVSVQDMLHNDIRSELNSINPQLMHDYDSSRQWWKENVIPYHIDKDLRAIAEGRTKNPEAGQVTNIFRNPEESINKVTSDIGDLGKDRILHLALGKNKEDLLPKELLSARKALDVNGLSSYVREPHEQNFRALRANLHAETEREAKAAADKAFVEQLRKMDEKLKKERASENKAQMKNYETAVTESNKIANKGTKEIKTDYERGMDEIEKQNATRKNIFKKIAKGAGITLLLGAGLKTEHELLKKYLQHFK